MDTAIDLDRESIRAACQRYGVRRLRIFGSVLTDRFDPSRSDVDFVVDFDRGRADPFDDYFGLRERLSEIVGRDVDLVVGRSMRNPYFRAAVLASAREVYAA